MSFWAVGEDGNGVELEELAMVIHPKTDRKYIFYTNYETDNQNRTKVFSSEILEELDGEGIRLRAVQTDEEWAYLEETLQLITELIELEDDDED